MLVRRVDELLAPAIEAATRSGASDVVLVDATLGMAGHTLALLTAHPRLRVIGIDRDPQALRIAERRLAAAGLTDRVELVHAVYDRIGEVIEQRVGSGRVQAILFDLGVSSVQLDESDRGFAYAQDAPLDMRMDPTTGITAADVVNTYPGAELTRILREYGDERFASRISKVAGRRAGAGSRSPPAPGWSNWSGPPSRRPPGGPAATRPSAPSRRCGSRSTTSSAPCGGRFPLPCNISRWPDGSW